jgi:hypothetical protein
MSRRIATGQFTDGSEQSKSRRRIGLFQSRLLAVLSAVAAITSLVFVPLAVTASSAGAAAQPFSISTNPQLVPAFSSKIYDYAIRCSGHSTTKVVTTGSRPVTVGGKTFDGPVNLEVPLKTGQSLQVTYAGVSYYARCLPSDFPTYSSTVTGHPGAEGYLLTLGSYSVVFDPSGVPVWWDTGVGTPSATEPNYAEFVNPSTIAWGTAKGSFQLVGLNGRVEKTIGGGPFQFDTHDFKILPNGDYLGFERVNRVVNLSSWGKSSKSTIIDDVIVEINPAGKIVWTWSAAAHINVSTANVDWRNQYPDVIHMNSLWYDGHGGIIFSARHLNAVYRIDMATGAITWKLGGTETPQSLKFTSSPYPTNFSGQHDAQLLPDGQLTLHDDGTRADRPPRGLLITINTNRMTATINKQVTDSRATYSGCCGSAIRLPDLDWVISWGENDFMTELSRTGVPQITITYPGQFSYRAELDEATVPAMRQGMDDMVAPLQL